VEAEVTWQEIRGLMDGCAETGNGQEFYLSTLSNTREQTAWWNDPDTPKRK
jgi:hypothetical protein